jgi:formylglycine-generating enzyme required for sulfatase activity
VFDKNGPIIKGADKEPISLRAGEHGVLIKRGDFSFEADKFMLKKGQTITLKLEWLAGKVQVVQDGKVVASHAIPPPPTFTNSLGMKFVWIPPGDFMMGSPKEEKDRKDNETQHKVTLTKGFYMGVYTVTQEEWQAVMGKNPSHFKGEKNLPVETVPWDDCQEFIKKLREKDKKLYRLPTEAEWEYSCRAGTTTPFYFGETISTEKANYNGEIYGTGKKGVSRGKTIPVGSFPANAFGLHDMHGNVWQWCQDWHGDYPQEDVVDPQGPDTGANGVVRGGSWDYGPLPCRSADRGWHGRGIGGSGLGLRVCFCLEEDGILAPKKDTPKKEEVAVPPNPFTNSIGMKFVWIPPGNFVMGSPKEEIGRQAAPGVDETQHKVTLTKGFYMGVYTVTQEQWQEVMGNNPSRVNGEKNLPVEMISWDDCQEFIKKLRDKDKKPYRLPSEAEWEYACRAGTKTPFYFGETISTDQANYNGEPYGNGKKGVKRGKTLPVGTFPANAWGLHDMHGNVWQWCDGWHGDYPQKDVVDPQGPEKGQFRMVRGGCFNNLPEEFRSARRNRVGPGYRECELGCRLCFSLEENGVLAPKNEPPKKEAAAVPPNPFTNSIGMKFVWIPPGSFMMGSPKEEKERQTVGGGDETQHKVTLTKGFYMDVYTVTQEQWQEVMGKNPSHFKGEKNLPVEQVSWDDCQEFIKKLREKDKKLYRLPFEAEWEYSCRAGTTTPFHFGETISTDQANYDGEIYGTGKKGVFRGKTIPVGSLPANAWGLYDTHGNVWQWCQDLYGDYPQKDVVDPTGPEKGQSRVMRGGSWHDDPQHCRSARRNWPPPGDRHSGVGFRLCFCLD